MRNILLVAVAIGLTAIGASAQTDTTASPADSITHQLGEVLVKASPVIHKSDRDLFIPSDEAREHANNGLGLLQNMQIPTVVVNPVMESVSNPSGAVQLRINGRVASINEVKMLLPESIVRVEYLENPGLRYNDANAVLDFIVRNPTVGGSLMADVMYWLHDKPSGNLFASLKLNRGKGQFGLSVQDQLRKRLEMYREYDEEVHFTDGSTLLRKESPVGGMYNNNQLWVTADYSYVDPDKTTFYASLNLSHQTPNSFGYDGILSSTYKPAGGESTATAPLYLSVEGWHPFTVPSLNLYLDKKIDEKQSIVVDFVARYTTSRSESSYDEYLVSDGSPVTAIGTQIRDNNWSVGLETDYIRQWRKSRLTAGLTWNGYFNRSTYVTSGNTVYHQNQNKLYAFAEYMQMLGPVTATAGIGIEYNEQYLRESGRSLHSLHAKPRINVTWRKDWSMLRLTAGTYTRTPSLSETNPTVQQIDRFQFQTGNPDLKSYSIWNASINWAQSFKRINSSLQVGYWSTSSDAIAPIYFWDNDRHLIKTFTNGHKNSMWWWRASASIDVIPDWLTIDGYIRMTRNYSSGPGYSHHNTSWSGNVDAIASHWGFQLIFSYMRANTDLTGEVLNRQESFNSIMLNYTWRNWQFGTGLMMPFGRYNQETTQLNRYYSYSQIMRSDFIERMAIVKISYNLQWGKQKEGARKRIDAGAESMTSTAAGR